MIRVRQLCGGGLYRDAPYWCETTWCGVLLSTATFWLRHLGWGLSRCGCGWAACGHAPLRLRLKGRCWVEDEAHPAVLHVDGERFAGVLPPLEKPTYATAPPRRRRARR